MYSFLQIGHSSGWSVLAAVALHSCSQPQQKGTCLQLWITMHFGFSKQDTHNSLSFSFSRPSFSTSIFASSILDYSKSKKSSGSTFSGFSSFLRLSCFNWNYALSFCICSGSGCSSSMISASSTPVSSMLMSSGFSFLIGIYDYAGSKACNWFLGSPSPCLAAYDRSSAFFGTPLREKSVSGLAIWY